MKAVKKINNNVAICLDRSGKEVVAFGKGIGFPAMPYEVPLSDIDRTFYNISDTYLDLFRDIPEDMLEFSAQIVTEAKALLPYELNPNLVLTMADHLSFAVKRQEQGIYIKMPPEYDMKQTYPLEMEIARRVLRRMKSELGISLLKNEITGVAMAIVSARLTEDEKSAEPARVRFEDIADKICAIIEDGLYIRVNRDSFGYARFCTHMQYLLDRIYKEDFLDSDNAVIYKELRNQYPEIGVCVDDIALFLESELSCTISEEEKLYLIMHVNRIVAKEE